MHWQTFISIHAPARGATQVRHTNSRKMFISIHAPARGATYGQYLKTVTEKFQSTLPREERLYIAPSRYSTTDFNPRSRERSDAETGKADLSQSISIHAPARGATSWPRSIITTSDYFNPRSRERSDVALDITIAYVAISIHAPARGATGNGKEVEASINISIHAPARGATPFPR